MNPSARSDQPSGTRVPCDLEPQEAEVGAWFARLDRVDAPEGLRHRVLAEGASAPTPPAGRLLRFPLGAWGLASAALLLLALGAAIAVELSDPVPAAPVDSHAAARAAADLAISEDDTLALYHGVETFDEVGMAPGELIADWGR
ncbi:MAG: hypothetical protein P1V36_09010 [Planctomycetota bacterium]|nr:hypothetical protein [Planctomycetota bacterium]